MSKVKEFVRNVLGCECPEEVFEHIEVDTGVKVADYTVERRINVGNRLLVYIVDGDELQGEDLKSLVITGKEERDDKGFNRFRFVVMSNDKPSLEGLQDLVKGYEKVHLHLISRDEIDF
ncbi:MAG: hypothetical protein ACOC5L_00735 [Halobacteriota archaeon]